LAHWGKTLPVGVAVGESWELPPEPREDFPILIKLLDAQETLSVQVHPDDALAGELYGEPGKSELWVVLEAAPGAFLYNGFRPGADAAAFEAALKDASLPSLLNALPVQAGDVVDVPAGRIHAVGAGCLLAEIQQPSDRTYRIWDWGRRVDGAPRELHLTEARRALRFDALGHADGRLEPVLVHEPWGRRERLAENAYFSVERWRPKLPVTLPPQARAWAFLALEEGLRLVWGREESLSVPRGSVALLPAALAARLEAAGTAFLVVRPV
jgi:mannose-6-phosphate isomerase